MTATADNTRQGQSGAGAVGLTNRQSATFWVYSATDGYSDLAFREKLRGTAGWIGVALVPTKYESSARVYLNAGVNKIVMTGDDGKVLLDKLTVTAAAQSKRVTYQAEDGRLTGTAHVDDSYSQAHGGVVTGVGNGPANALALTVQAPKAGSYAMTVRFANPDLMTAPADISVNGGPTVHFNFANTFSWNQFWDVTIPVVLERGTNTIRFIANQQYNYDGHTVGVIYSGGNGVGAALRASTAPNIDQIALAPRQVAAPS